MQEIFFSLLYTTHGGSGLTLSMSEVLELDYAQVEWWSERLDRQRSREAAAMRRK